MKRVCLIIISFLLVSALLCGCGGGGGAMRDSADYLITAVQEPQTGISGGDWTVFALAQSGFLPNSWRGEYFAELEAAMNGENTFDRNTDYSRTAFAVRALGADPRDAGGIDLLSPLEDVEKTAAQGTAGIAYALLALGEDCSNELRERYLEKLLAYQLPGGSFAAQGETEPDADLTAISLLALAQIRTLIDVEEEISAALAALSDMQNPDGSFSNYGVPTAESTAQVIIALCALEISPKTDSSFIIEGKGGKGESVYEALMGFRVSDGGFSHTAEGKSNIIATEQALCSLAAVSRLENGEAPLFDFSAVGESLSCSISVECGELLDKLSLLDSSKQGLVPENGVIYENENAVFEVGESVFDLMRRELKSAGIHLEFTLTPVIGTAYIEGINNLYEFDCGESSGWIFSVNGEYPGFSCSEHKLKNGDAVVFEFVCSKREVGQ